MRSDIEAYFKERVNQMDYLIFAITMIGIFVFIFVQGKLIEKKEALYYKKKLRETKGKLPQKEYKVERFLSIPGYYEKHKEDFQIDDITWNDLGMDDVFVRMNYNISSTGEEYLYYMLRTPGFQKDNLEHFNEVVEYFATYDNDRVQYQWCMHKLGTTGKYSLYDYLDYLEKLKKRSNIKDIVMLIVLIGFVLISFVELSIGIFGLLIWMLIQMFSYFAVKKENEPYLTSLGYVMRLLAVSEQVGGSLPKVCEKERDIILEAGKVLKKAKKGSFWVFGSMYKTGSPLDVLFDYLRMMLHFDLIYFNHMLNEITSHKKETDDLITTMGWLESAISVGLFRASLTSGWCEPQLDHTEFTIQNGYHPLIMKPVKNSIRTSGSVLLTGSNASGKSTFLKMLALNSLLAQTIYTVAADEYKAPFYHLYSSMSLRDDLESGDSYYIVEIKSIKRIIDSMKKSNGKILCFVDEVLRGTNTVERIAASSQILLSMSGEGVQCFAATHDIELTYLLEDVFENYHFEEDIKDKDILFNYQLKRGKATGRNAIKLLEIMGYENSIITKARKQADGFLKNGVWELP